MKHIFLAIFLALVALSVLAARLLPRRDPGGPLDLYWVTDNNPARAAQVQAYSEFMRAKTGREVALHVDANSVGQGQKVIVQAQGGFGGDIIDIGYIGNLHDFVKGGILEPVDPAWADANRCSPRFTWATIAPQITVGGVQYSFPCNVNADVLFWNRKLLRARERELRQAGIRLPLPRVLTWEDFRTIGRILAVRDEKGRLREPYLAMSLSKELLVWQCGGWFFNETGTRCTVASPEAERAWQLYHDMIFKDRILPTPSEAATAATGGGWNSEQDLFVAGRMATLAVGRWGLIKIRTGQYEHRDGRPVLDEKGVARLLPDALEADATLLPIDALRREKVFFVTARSAGVSRTCRNKEAAREFLAYLASEPYNLLINEAADAMPPTPPEASTARNQALYRHNPVFPLETEEMNETFQEAIRCGRNHEMSPFVQDADLVRILQTAWDRVVNGQDSIGDALRRAQDEVHRQMEENMRYRPSLRAQFASLSKAQQDMDRGLRPSPRRATTMPAAAPGGRP